jgi:hypothetical protein
MFQSRTSPISKAKLAANRANAQLSTGPVTPEGKAASSQNNFKHGLYSKQIVASGEDPVELDALKTDLRAEHQPASLTEEMLVNEIAEQYWRLKRARRMEANLFTNGDLLIAHMNAVIRLMSSAERGYYKALKTLGELQKQRGFVPQTKEVPQRLVSAVPAPPSRKAPASAGFESQKPATGSAEEELALLEAEFAAIEHLQKAA